MGSIRGQLSGIAFHFKSLGFPEFSSDFWLRKMLEEWSREAGIRKDDWCPIIPEILQGLLLTWQRVCSSDFEACLFHAISLVAFWGELRVSELMA